MKSLAFLDYAVIAAFFATMIGVGVYYSRKSKSSDQFFGNDKTVPWWLSGVSFYMNSFSALAFVMYSALAYKYGWVAATLSWTSVVSALVVLALLAKRWRRVGAASPLDYLCERFGTRTNQSVTKPAPSTAIIAARLGANITPLPTVPMSRPNLSAMNVGAQLMQAFAQKTRAT